MHHISFFFVLIILAWKMARCENVTVTYEVSKCGELSLPKGYNKLLLPFPQNSPLSKTEISLYIRSVVEIDEQNGDIILDADLGMQWFDESLYLLHDSLNWTNLESGWPIGNATFGPEVLNCIWTPDVFIDQLVDVKATSILSKTIQVNFISGKLGVDDSAGDITYSSRMKIKLKCGMSFEYYPADIQSCLYIIRSYSYTAEKFTLYWRVLEQVYLADTYNPNFDLMVSNVEPGATYNEYFIQENFDKFRKGNYSALYFIIKTRRRLSYHLVQTYLPTCLLIFITWLCFILPTDMVEARIGISMTTLLTLTATFAAIREQSPKVSYTMAIDVWMVFNIFIIFLALLLFATIYWMKLRSNRKTVERQEEEGEVTPEVNNSSNQSKLKRAAAPYGYRSVLRLSKRHGFRSFTCIFLTFFVSYWAWLLLSSKYFEWDPPLQYNADLQKGSSGSDSLAKYSGFGTPGMERKELLEKVYKECTEGKTYKYKPAFSSEFDYPCPENFEELFKLLQSQVASNSELFKGNKLCFVCTIIYIFLNIGVL